MYIKIIDPLFFGIIVNLWDAEGFASSSILGKRYQTVENGNVVSCFTPTFKIRTEFCKNLSVDILHNFVFTFFSRNLSCKEFL